MASKAYQKADKELIQIETARAKAAKTGQLSD
jgi:hypothetical protein